MPNSFDIVRNFDQAVAESDQSRLSPLYGWTARVEEPWKYFSPPGHLRAMQGWKIHVSSVPTDALSTFNVVSKACKKFGCAFKCTRNLANLQTINASRAMRGGGGKFITIYPPAGFDRYSEMANLLSAETANFKGPRILSDQKYSSIGNVYYRYGGFASNLVLSDDGSFELSLIGPSGEYYSDERKAWFQLPKWIDSDPFTSADSFRREPEARESPDSVLIGGRYKVTMALRHSFRGGVYKASDTQTGSEVVLKQARQHTASDIYGRDAVDTLRHEAKMLQVFGPKDVSPNFIEFLEYQGDYFLVEEFVDGVSLDQWVLDLEEDEQGYSEKLARRYSVIRSVAQSLGVISDAGYAVRDLAPGNIMVKSSDDGVLFIDPEYFAPLGSSLPTIHTPGFAPPEVAITLQDEFSFMEASSESDVFSFGVTSVYVLTGAPPIYLDDDRLCSMIRRNSAERAKDIFLAAIGAGLGAYESLILRCLSSDQSARPTLEELTDGLAADIKATDNTNRDTLRDSQQVASAVHSLGNFNAAEAAREMVSGAISLLEKRASWGEDHLWPPLRYENKISDPINVQSGAGGILRVLTEVAEQAAATNRDIGERAARLADRTARWIVDKAEDRERHLPGLYFGSAGTAWALMDYGNFVNDDKFVDAGLKLLRRLPVSWDSPDVTHGLAGLGLTHLHAVSRFNDEESKESVELIAESLLNRAERSGTKLAWNASENPTSALRNIQHLGFAHGIAGIAYFLSQLEDQGIEDPRLSVTIEESLETLKESAIINDDTITWPTGDPSQSGEGLVWWCSGSVGVGLFLLDLAKRPSYKQDEGIPSLLTGAANAAVSKRWQLSPSSCHGLGSTGNFLLDLVDEYRSSRADDINLPRLQTQSEQLVSVLATRAGIVEGDLVIPGDSNSTIDFGYNTGLMGSVSFLNRFIHGGQHPFMIN